MDTNLNNFTPSKMFADIIQQFVNTGVLLDTKFIKKLLNKWKIKAFRISSDGKVFVFEVLYLFNRPKVKS
jgi:hypothetical protein